jgi:hypothetical protein
MPGRRVRHGHRPHGVRGGATGGDTLTASMRRGWRRGNIGTKGVAPDKVFKGKAHRSDTATARWQSGAAQRRSNGGNEASVVGDDG